MEYLAGLWLCMLSISLARAATIKQIIETRPELTELRNHFKNFNSDHFSNILGGDRSSYTFIAPNNDAFSRLPKKLKDILSRTSSQGRETFRDLMLYHTAEQVTVPGIGEVNVPIRSSDFSDNAKGIATMHGTEAFYFKDPQNYYINNARVVTADISASNGVVHIVDTVMHPVGEIYPLLGHIQNPQNTMYSEFTKLLRAYDNGNAISCLRSGPALSTVFVPTNEAFSRIPIGVLSQLRNSPDDLKQVVDSHVICGKVLPMAYLNDTAPRYIPALEGVVETSVFRYELYVKNNCVQGKVLPGSATTSNGVLHPVDTVLGFRHNSLLQEIDSRNDLRRFYGHVQSSNVVREQLKWEGLPGTEVPQDQIYTIFAVVDSAMDGVDLTQMDLDNILHYHMVQGYYTMSDMQTVTDKRNTMGIAPLTNRLAPLGVSTRIDPSTGLTDIFVEVNYVVAKIIKGDICVKNGLLHIINNVLGIATEETMQFLFNQPELLEFGRIVTDVGLDGDMNFKKLTVFAPTNTAFERMKLTNIGAKLLSDEYIPQLRNVFMRHMVIGEGIILTDNNVPQALESEFDELTVKKVGNQFFVTFNRNQDVLITRPNIRTKTAVVHIIDEVMYVDDSMALELVGSGVKTSSSIILLLLAYFMCRNLS